MLNQSLHIQNNDCQVLKKQLFKLIPFLSQNFALPLFHLSEFCCQHSFSASELFSHQSFHYCSQSSQLFYYTLDTGITVISTFQNFLLYNPNAFILCLFYIIFLLFLGFYFDDDLVDCSPVEYLVYKKPQITSVTLSSRVLFSLL